MEMEIRKDEISNAQNDEIRPYELTTVELDAVSGGGRLSWRPLSFLAVAGS
jgi:hypothetical protein